MIDRPQDVALLPLPEPTKPPFYFCNKCGHMGAVGPSHPDANGTGEMCDYHATGGEKWYGPDEVNAINRANVTAALASAQAREDELRKIAERIQYADTHAQAAKDDAGDFICLPPWLWLQIRDAARAALSTNAATQTGETT